MPSSIRPYLVGVLTVSIWVGNLARSQDTSQQKPKATRESSSSSDQLSLKPLLSGDFQTDTRSKYEIKGNVDWKRGRLTLHKGSSISKKVETGSWVEFQLRLQWHELRKDGDQNSTQLRLGFDGATDCVVRWDWKHQEGKTSGRLCILDTIQKDGVSEYQVGSRIPVTPRVDEYYLALVLPQRSLANRFTD